MSSTAFEVKFEEPKKSVPENLLSPREPVNPNAVKLRVEHKLKVADDRRKSQLENVISKQKKHVSITNQT